MSAPASLIKRQLNECWDHNPPPSPPAQQGGWSLAGGQDPLRLGPPAPQEGEGAPSGPTQKAAGGTPVSGTLPAGPPPIHLTTARPPVGTAGQRRPVVQWHQGTASARVLRMAQTGRGICKLGYGAEGLTLHKLQHSSSSLRGINGRKPTSK